MATSNPSSNSSSGKEKRYKMVLIGETGSGKTNLIELLLNYAMQHGVKGFDVDKVSSFVVSDKTATEKKSWESDTTQSKKYEAVFGDFTLDIIDTPGFADTRGEQQKKENIANIINKVKEELYVNSICLVINGTQVRLTSVLSEVITEIVSILPPDVLRNIIIIFTKTRDEMSLKFDPKLLKEFQLSVRDDYIFTLDNPFSRWESVRYQGLNEKNKKKLSGDFKEAHETLEEMFDLITTLKPALTLKFGEFHDAIEDIETSLAIVRVAHENKKKVEELMIQTDLQKVTKVEYEQTSVETTNSKHVVCTKSGCNSNCHKNCDCWFVWLTISACTKISLSECNCCHHSPSLHKRTNYYFDTIKREILVPDHEKKKGLQMEMSFFDKQVEEETHTLELKLKKFESLGSNGFFSENAKKHVISLIDVIRSMPGTAWKESILILLSAYLDVLKNPLTAKDEDTKFRWACGILGVNPDSVSHEEISKIFRQQAKRFHPDSSKDESTSSWFKNLNYAKDFVSKKLFHQK